MTYFSDIGTTVDFLNVGEEIATLTHLDGVVGGQPVSWPRPMPSPGPAGVPTTVDQPNEQFADVLTSDVPNIADANSWLLGELLVLEKMHDLDNEWESTGAAPPNESAIKAASGVLVRLAQADCRPSHIDPSTAEGVCLSFANAERYADIECFNSGEVLAVVAAPDGREQCWPVERKNAEDSIRRIKSFVESAER